MAAAIHRRARWSDEDSPRVAHGRTATTRIRRISAGMARDDV